MIMFPFQISNVMHLHNRMTKLKPSNILETGQNEPKDIVNISSEAKRRQIREQTKSAVMEKIKRPK